MPKIKGKFAPMFEELGNDPRWLLELSDYEKFIYFLILCTIYWSNGTAPDDARYYQRRYNLRARPYQVQRSLDAVKLRFSKLVASDKKLSLLNYVGYEAMVSASKSLEVDIEREVDIEGQKTMPLKAKSPSLEAEFLKFWGVYPKKKAKNDALKAFNKLAPAPELLAQMLRAIETTKKSKEWMDNNGQYIPYPATWINGRRWEDVGFSAEASQRVPKFAVD